MRIERQTTAGVRDYYTVLVEADELVTASGRTMPYSAWIGTITGPEEITLWYPAAPLPRGYKAAALKLLRKAQARVRAGEIDEEGQA